MDTVGVEDENEPKNAEVITNELVPSLYTISTRWGGLTQGGGEVYTSVSPISHIVHAPDVPLLLKFAVWFVPSTRIWNDCHSSRSPPSWLTNTVQLWLVMIALIEGNFCGGGCDHSTTPTMETAATTILIKMTDPMISDTARLFS
jgi:hypothetical protein